MASGVLGEFGDDVGGTWRFRKIQQIVIIGPNSSDKAQATVDHYRPMWHFPPSNPSSAF